MLAGIITRLGQYPRHHDARRVLGVRPRGTSFQTRICGLVLVATAVGLLPAALAASPRLAVPGHPELGIAEPDVVTIELSSVRCAPRRLVLAPGTPVVLRLRNETGDKASLSAAEFFAASRVDADGDPPVRDGRVELAPHSTLDVLVTPSAGRFSMRCTHDIRAASGPTGKIEVR